MCLPSERILRPCLLTTRTIIDNPRSRSIRSWHALRAAFFRRRRERRMIFMHFDCRSENVVPILFSCSSETAANLIFSVRERVIDCNYRTLSNRISQSLKVKYIGRDVALWIWLSDFLRKRGRERTPFDGRQQQTLPAYRDCPSYKFNYHVTPLGIVLILPRREKRRWHLFAYIIDTAAVMSRVLN